MTKKEKRVAFILCLIAFGQQLINVFISFDADTAYALTMSYRMALGDKMLVDMWEPHQTSAFLLAGLIRLFRYFAGSNTGIVLFANGMGIIINLILVIMIYRFFKDRMDPLLLFLMCLFMVIARPKGYLLPDFSNMQIWFLTLTLLCLLQYFDGGRKQRWIILASIFLCLEIIAYPSCVITYIGVVFLFWLYSDRKWRDILSFSAACFAQGMAYITYFVLSRGYTECRENIRYLLLGDSAHEGFRFRSSFFRPLGVAAVWLLCCLILSAIMVYVDRKIKKREVVSKKETVYLVVRWFFFIALITNCIGKIVRKIWLQNAMHSVWLTLSALYLVMFGIALLGLKYCSEREKRQTIIGYVLSFGSLLAVITLTNLDFLSAVSYMLPAVMVSYVPMYKLIDHYEDNAVRLHKMLPFLALFAVVAVNTSINLADCRGMIKKGPAIGVVTNYMDSLKFNVSMEEWGDYVHPGESLVVVGGGGLNTIEYLYEDTAVGMHSVMCDPTYNEILLKYWQMHPERYPDVIAVESWYGDLRVDEDDWIMHWIEEKYQPAVYEDKEFWRFYRKK